MNFWVVVLLLVVVADAGYVYRTHHQPQLYNNYYGLYQPRTTGWLGAPVASPLFRTYSPGYRTYLNPAQVAPGFNYGFSVPHGGHTRVVTAVAPAASILKTTAEVVAPVVPQTYASAYTSGFNYGFSVPHGGHTQVVTTGVAPVPPILKTAEVVAPVVAPVLPQAYAPAYTAKSQYHEQNAAGEYNFGYIGDTSSRQETRSSDGTVMGQYAYLDSNNVPQQVNYIADALGFRVAATNLPVDTNSPPAVVVPGTTGYVATNAAVVEPQTVLARTTGPVLLDAINPHVPYTPAVAAARAEHFDALLATA